MTLLSGGRYFWGVVTFGSSSAWMPLLSDGRYFWEVVTFGGSLLLILAALG